MIRTARFCYFPLLSRYDVGVGAGGSFTCFPWVEEPEEEADLVGCSRLPHRPPKTIFSHAAFSVLLSSIVPCVRLNKALSGPSFWRHTR